MEKNIRKCAFWHISNPTPILMERLSFWRRFIRKRWHIIKSMVWLLAHDPIVWMMPSLIIADKSKDYFVTVEFGIESTLDRTLERINRQHSYQEATEAIKETRKRNIQMGAHLILGLPGESRDDQLEHAKRISELPIDTLKLHQLQIVKNTTFAKEYKNKSTDFHLYELEEYIGFCVDFLELLRPGIAVERFVNQSPGDMLIAPTWGLKNFEIVTKIEKRLKERSTWQGRLSGRS